MRWDRLFDDLEGESAALAQEETDALADDLRDDTWASTSWRELLGGAVVLDVRGCGQITGDVVAVTAELVRLRTATAEHVVATSAVSGVLSAQRRAEPVSRIDAALGWRSVLRRLRDDDASVRVVLDDGRALDGRVDVVGHDFVALVAADAGASDDRRRIVVLAAVAVVSTRD